MPTYFTPLIDGQDADAVTFNAPLAELDNAIVALAANAGASGWAELNATLVYASADDPTYVATCVGVDLTGTLSVGMRFRVSQTTGGTKYFIITAISFSTDTTITLYGGTDYDLANEAINSPRYSVAKAPHGFPLDPAKWTAEATDTTSRTQDSPVQNTWYNLGGFNLSVPVGLWRLEYSVAISISGASADWQAFTTLSTANNSESDADLTTWSRMIPVTGLYAVASRAKTVSAASKTTMYLNSRTVSSSATQLANRNDVVKGVIRAVCAYL